MEFDNYLNQHIHEAYVAKGKQSIKPEHLEELERSSVEKGRMHEYQ